MGPEPVPGHPIAGMHIWGWMSPYELEWLRTKAESMESIVEVGPGRGRSSFALLTGCSGPVYCIDPWNDEQRLCQQVHLNNCGHFPNLIQIQGFSPAAGAKVPGKVDMVFQDGDHTYEGLMADLEYWYPRTRRLMAGHDHRHEAYPGVAKAVEDFFLKIPGLRIEETPSHRGMYETEDGPNIWYVWLS